VPHGVGPSVGPLRQGRGALQTTGIAGAYKDRVTHIDEGKKGLEFPLRQAGAIVGVFQDDGQVLRCEVP